MQWKALKERAGINLKTIFLASLLFLLHTQYNTLFCMFPIATLPPGSSSGGTQTLTPPSLFCSQAHPTASSTPFSTEPLNP